MTKARLEAFSDGVIAIIITIMVLELKPPTAGDPESYRHLAVQLLSYVLSFTYVAIYWVNHHHMLHAVQKVNGAVLWLNMLLLFFLSLFPFCTAWIGESHFATLPVVAYGAVLLAASLAYYFLAHCLAGLHGPDSVLAQALGSDVKGKLSTGLYVVGMLLAPFSRWAAYGVYVSVALIWLVPDRRIESRLNAAEGGAKRRVRR
jgi:uncharacterized membrane protein